MTTYTAEQMAESFQDGFREGIIQGRNRQAKESNAAMRDHWKQGYAAALQDATTTLILKEDHEIFRQSNTQR